MTAKISVQVHPGASRNEITGFIEGVFHIKVAAPPVEGKANRELVEFLSRRLDVPKTALTIIKGHTSRHKVVAVAGLSQEDIMPRLWPSSSAGASK